MDDKSSLMLIDNNGTFEIDDQSHMDVDADTNDGLLPQPVKQPGKRRRKKSMVWEHFTIESATPGSMKACCNHCKKSFAYITGQKLAGTSHLKRHIQLGICPMSRENSSSQFAQICDTNDDCTTCPPKKRQRSSPYMKVPLDQGRCYNEMAKMIIMHDYPLHMVEHSGFTGFVQALRPQFSMASFNTIHSDCVSMYLSEKQKLSEFINEIPGRVNLTVDMWTSNQSVGYAFVTGHFIDKDWNLTHRLLNVAVVPFPDSDYALNQPIAACLSDWNLERRLSSLTVGQSVVNKNCVENLRCCLSTRDQHVLNGQLLLGNCYARLLSSMAQDVLRAGDLQTPIKKVRDSVKYVKTKDSCRERFDELKMQLQTPSAKDLLIDDQTKWDTSYNMLLAAFEHKEVFSSLGNCDPDYKVSTSPEEWRKIEVLCLCLKILFDAANVLTDPTRLTANDLYHEMTKLQLEVSHAAMSEDADMRNLANPLREKFDEYWRGCFLLLAIAVVMDPRFKMKLIEFSFSKAYGEDADKWIKSVDDAVHDLYHDYAEQSHSLLDAYVGHGNDGFSETDMSQVHFHHEMPQAYHHSNGISHDQIYEQPEDGSTLNEKPRDHVLDSHETQEVAQTQVNEHGQEEKIAEPLHHEDQSGEIAPQENQPMEGLSGKGQETGTMSVGDDTTQGVERSDQLVDAGTEDDSHPGEGYAPDTQAVDEMVKDTQQVEEVAQELPLENLQVDEKGITQDTEPVEEMLEDAQLVEEAGQETQLVEEKHNDIQPVEEVVHETDPVEGIQEDTQLVEEVVQETQPAEQSPEHSQNPQNSDGLPRQEYPQEGVRQPDEGIASEEHPSTVQVEETQPDSQSHAMPQEEATFTISQESHHVDVLLQEGHHLEASSQEFPLITIGDGFSDFELYISEVGNQPQMKSELDQYLKESLIPRSQEFEVLGWWSLNRTKYPVLSKMAADVLSLPFCTVSPDSVFHTEVKKMDNYRSSLRHVTLEALFCAKDWFKHGSKRES